MLGILRGKKPGKTVAIREDIDALPMPELTELPFASEIPNVCHSCGHDIHTAVLLTFAKILAAHPELVCGLSSRRPKKSSREALRRSVRRVS